MATLKELGGSELVKDSRKDINDNFNALNTELGGKSATGHIHKLSDMTADSAHRTVTDTEKSTWSNKADAHSHPYASNSHSHSKSDIGLSAVENKSSATIRGEITAANINAVATQAATGSTAVKRNSSGDIYCRYIRATAGFTTSTPTAFWVEISSDTLMRKMTVANVKSKLNIKSNAERACTISTASPSGGSNGDVWYKY